LSDGEAWVSGEIIQSVHLIYHLNREYCHILLRTIRKYPVIIKFKSEFFETNNEELGFKLRLVEGFTKVNEVIGAPLKYRDLLESRDIEATFQSRSEATTKFAISQVKNKLPCRISGSLEGRVTRIHVSHSGVGAVFFDLEDENRDSIQCCMFAETAKKIIQILSIDSFYRVSNPKLQ